MPSSIKLLFLSVLFSNGVTISSRRNRLMPRRYKRAKLPRALNDNVAEDFLTACVSSFSGYSGNLSAYGDVMVSFYGIGTSTKSYLEYDMTGLGSNCTDCKLAIHEGKSCETEMTIGGEFWNSLTVSDPWLTANVGKYNSNQNGRAMGAFSLDNGYTKSENLGRVIIFYAQDGRTKIGCGILQIEYEGICTWLGPDSTGETSMVNQTVVTVTQRAGHMSKSSKAPTSSAPHSPTHSGTSPPSTSKSSKSPRSHTNGPTPTHSGTSPPSPSKSSKSSKSGSNGPTPTHSGTSTPSPSKSSKSSKNGSHGPTPTHSGTSPPSPSKSSKSSKNGSHGPAPTRSGTSPPSTSKSSKSSKNYSKGSSPTDSGDGPSSSKSGKSSKNYSKGSSPTDSGDGPSSSKSGKSSKNYSKGTSPTNSGDSRNYSKNSKNSSGKVYKRSGTGSAQYHSYQMKSSKSSRSRPY